MKKLIIPFTTLALITAMNAEANPRAAAEMAKRSMAAAEAAKAVRLQQEAAARSRAMFEQIQRNQAANQKNLFIQSEVQKNLAAAKASAPAATKPTMGQAFRAQANPGIVYHRQISGGYIGQAKSLPRFEARKVEHTAAMRKEFGANAQPSFRIVAGAPGGDARLLRVAEETALRAERQFTGSVQNKIPAMNDVKFTTAIKGI